ncbi:hypothetical protein LOZ52_004078, partial [Ophidiomyces ophidiicola]
VLVRGTNPARAAAATTTTATTVTAELCTLLDGLPWGGAGHRRQFQRGAQAARLANAATPGLGSSAHTAPAYPVPVETSGGLSGGKLRRRTWGGGWGGGGEGKLAGTVNVQTAGHKLWAGKKSDGDTRTKAEESREEEEKSQRRAGGKPGKIYEQREGANSKRKV